MKHCQKCNRDFPDTKKFCENCGATLTSSQPAPSLGCPHCGEPVKPGWKFCATCQTKLPESIVDQNAASSRPSTSRTQPVATPISPPSQVLTDTPNLKNTVAHTPVFVRCRNCKQLVEEDATFCEHCGANMFEETAPLITPPAAPPPTERLPSQQTYRRDTVYEAANADETTEVGRKPYASGRASVPHETTAERAAPSLSILQNYGEPEPAPQFKWWHGLLVAVFVFMVFAALVAGGWYLWSNRASEAQSPPQPVASPAPATSTPSTSAGTANQAQTADDELKQLRSWRVGAPPADAERIVAAIESAEKKYPTDYRFPYERAKLSIKGMISHHEAFEAIFLAGERAIDNGKAEQMLSDLMADKDGDFYKMSRGHHEWATLEAALKNNDKNALAVHHE